VASAEIDVETGADQDFACEVRKGRLVMKRYFLSLLASMLLLGITVVAQSAPEIRFDSEPSLLKLPDSIHLGEAAGVATDSKGKRKIQKNILIKNKKRKDKNKNKIKKAAKANM
jgi:hypothetical protein